MKKIYGQWYINKNMKDMKAMNIWWNAAKCQLLSPAGDHPPAKLPLIAGNQDLGGGHWALSKHTFVTKISITFWRFFFRIEFCPDLLNSHSGMWRLLAPSLGPTLGNSLRKCGSEAAFEDGSHFPNPSSYLAGLISEYFQGAPRIPYKPVFLDGWSPGYVTFADENQVFPNLRLHRIYSP